MGKSVRQEIDAMIGAAEREGFTVKEKRSGVMVCGDGGMVMLHRTLSDHRGLKNARSRLRGIGVPV